MKDENGARPRGRPRLEISPDAVADAVSALFAEGGVESVSISATADKLGVSRATLYRTVPSKVQLLGILFERATNELYASAKTIIDEHDQGMDRLHHLVCLQVDAAIRMRRFMPVFFGGIGIPHDVFQRWHTWSRSYEHLWVETVELAMAEGALQHADSVVTARLLLGMCTWVSRWYRPKEPYRMQDISDVAIGLIVGLVPAETPH